MRPCLKISKKYRDYQFVLRNFVFSCSGGSKIFAKGAIMDCILVFSHLNIVCKFYKKKSKKMPIPCSTNETSECTLYFRTEVVILMKKLQFQLDCTFPETLKSF